MRLSDSSMVIISMTPVSASPATPIAVSRPARSVKELIWSASADRPSASGRTFSSTYSCRAATT
jgi:hypothetical protein